MSEKKKVVLISAKDLAEKRGYVVKESGSITTSWKRKWLVLAGLQLFTFKDNMAKEPDGFLTLSTDTLLLISHKDIMNFKRQVSSNSSMPHMIGIIEHLKDVDTRYAFLSFESDEIKREWTEAILQNINALKRALSTTTKGKETKHEDETTLRLDRLLLPQGNPLFLSLSDSVTETNNVLSEVWKMYTVETPKLDNLEAYGLKKAKNQISTLVTSVTAIRDTLSKRLDSYRDSLLEGSAQNGSVRSYAADVRKAEKLLAAVKMVRNEFLHGVSEVFLDIYLLLSQLVLFDTLSEGKIIGKVKVPLREGTSCKIIELEKEIDIWGYFVFQSAKLRTAILKYQKSFKNYKEWLNLFEDIHKKSLTKKLFLKNQTETDEKTQEDGVELQESNFSIGSNSSDE